ncbi:MAG: hypothetical protein EP329_08550 [Deltaproteobacteria bacterium]|nr:MAG: hypothetical protein EP329_08550 [Deltaproteobacteria bacterium]
MKNGKVYVSERFRGCGTSFTTEAPIYTFTLTEPMTDLRVWVDAPAVLTIPAEGSPYQCIKGGVVYYKDWPAGTYEIYMFGNAIGVGGNIRIEMPERARVEADALVAAAPELTLDPDAAEPNPHWTVLKGTANVRPELAGVGCGHPGMTPLARLAPTVDMAWTFSVDRDHSLYVVNAKGGCLNKHSNSGAYSLKAGQPYVLWGWKDGGAAGVDFDVQIGADDRPERFLAESAPVYELGALESPIALASTLQQPATWGKRRIGLCWRLPRTPSFFVHASEDVGKVAIEPLRNAGRAPQMIVYGPLEDVQAHRDWRCDETTKVAVASMPGKTWAVFLLQQDGEVGAPIVSVARRLDRKPDPMAAPIAIPDEVPLKERRLGRNYPYYGKTSVERFFLEAPERLFVWLTAPEGELPANEPLALVDFRGDRATVARFEGTTQEVPLAALATTRPEAVALPKTHPPVKKAEDLDEALSLAGPAEKKLVDAYTEAEEKYRGCVGDYMAKHDPSWGKDYELIYVNSGRNVTDVWFRRADKACNYAGLEVKGKRLTAAINTSRKKSAAAYLKALRARFGG